MKFTSGWKNSSVFTNNQNLLVKFISKYLSIIIDKFLLLVIIPQFYSSTDSLPMNIFTDNLNSKIRW